MYALEVVVVAAAVVVVVVVDCSLWTEKVGYSQEVMTLEVEEMMMKRYYPQVIEMEFELVLDDTEMALELY